MTDASSDDGPYELPDEIDLALSKCLDEQSSLKKISIVRLSKGNYKFENKAYELRILQGNNLAIKMYAGFIYADCLVHFEEELLKIIK